MYSTFLFFYRQRIPINLLTSLPISEIEAEECLFIYFVCLCRRFESLPLPEEAPARLTLDDGDGEALRRHIRDHDAVHHRVLAQPHFRGRRRWGLHAAAGPQNHRLTVVVLGLQEGGNRLLREAVGGRGGRNIWLCARVEVIIVLLVGVVGGGLGFIVWRLGEAADRV